MGPEPDAVTKVSKEDVECEAGLICCYSGPEEIREPAHGRQKQLQLRHAVPNNNSKFSSPARFYCSPVWITDAYQ